MSHQTFVTDLSPITAIRRAVIPCAIVALIVILFFWIGDDAIAGPGVTTLGTTSRTLAALWIAGVLAIDIWLPVPSSLVLVAAGTILGRGVGAAAGTAGLTLGCVVGYVSARLGARAVSAVARDDLDWLAAAMTRHGALLLVICRPIPVLAEASVLVAGLTRFDAARFVMITMLANIGIASLYAILGASATSTGSFLLVFAASCALPCLCALAFTRLSAAGGTERA